MGESWSTGHTRSGEEKESSPLGGKCHDSKTLVGTGDPGGKVDVSHNSPGKKGVGRTEQRKKK